MREHQHFGVAFGIGGRATIGDRSRDDRDVYGHSSGGSGGIEELNPTISARGFRG